MKPIHFKGFTVCLLALSLLLFGQCGDKAEAPTEPEKKAENIARFNTVTVTPGELGRSLNITGRVVPVQKVSVVAEVGGKALQTQKPFEEGTEYRRGQLMVAIDDTDFGYNLRAQKSQYLNAILRVMSDIKLDYPEHHAAFEEYLRKLDVDKPVPPLPKVEQESQLRYFLAANNIYNLYYNLKSQEEKATDFRIYAPFDGVVTMAEVDPGDIVRPGVKLGEVIRTDVYEVKAAVSAGDLKYLEEGRKIEMTARQFDETYEATVVRFGKRVDASTQSVTVYLRVQGDDLKEGMYLEGEVELDGFSDAAELPKEALTRENQVYVIADSLVKLKEVEPLAYRQGTVLVKGLQAGDKIIIDEVKRPVLGTKAISKK